MNKTQCNVILQAMLENDNREWTAKNFQSGKYFVGYEASEYPKYSKLYLLICQDSIPPYPHFRFLMPVGFRFRFSVQHQRFPAW